MQLIPTDIRNPLEPGEPLYVLGRPLTPWRAWWGRLRLFLSIVWRRHETKRISIATAWDVARVVYP